MSAEDEKYKIVLPPLSLLTKEQEKQIEENIKVNFSFSTKTL